ncbi:hypothetical protein KL918_005370 [Ogataea parapolymorpha]|uniref:Uncharacterized protein n=1 Tax=Ogataea parapolymorpha (strain ATCC 26012 / BCRC 20466 / JCM 22074 / NRRL Y-7560 / DL-1) TaxID=871575 RepID=W1QD31_OGAPD|nr:hypothetical protein HPODL_03255 [Ogataea parapolymorpha DL-1]ESW99364.1 hypothetical protein HPODL_03255 [Ogataea parapolymorpha DL-1]KAG7864632.1 hypothetical protein KL918_005370 [Ogataea parapolymorpha]KAG7868499.1 hypothetical protein KL916_005275 [Ogataea parapolymorpha]
MLAFLLILPIILAIPCNVIIVDEYGLSLNLNRSVAIDQCLERFAPKDYLLALPQTTENEKVLQDILETVAEADTDLIARFFAIIHYYGFDNSIAALTNPPKLNVLYSKMMKAYGRDGTLDDIAECAEFKPAQNHSFSLNAIPVYEKMGMIS